MKNVLAIFLLRGWSAMTVFLSTLLTLMCLGKYTNGVWITISTMLVWIDMMDVGLGNGLRNKLATYVAHDDYQNARIVVTSTFGMLIAIMLPIMATLLLIVHNVNVADFLNVDVAQVPDVVPALEAAVLLVGSSFVFKFIGNLYMGLQLPAVSTLITTLGQTLSVVMTAVAYYCGWHSLLAISIVTTASPLCVWCVAYPLTFHVRYPQLRPQFSMFRLESVKGLFGLGIQFFVIQICGMLLLMSSSVLISKWFSPEYVTPYNIAYRYCSIVLLVFTVVCSPFWSATTDAYERKDWKWLRKAGRTMDYAVIALALLMVLMVVVSPWVYYLWINKWQHEEVLIPLSMTSLMALYQMILIVSLRYSNFLNGFGALRLQVYAIIFASLILVPLGKVVTCYIPDVNGLLVTLCVVNLPGLILNYVQYRKIMTDTAEGFWRIR